MKTKPLVKKEKAALRCYACNHRCLIPEGHAGVCGVRANDEKKFRLLVYGRPCAVWVDPIEKKPLFHFLPGTPSYSIGTFGCNFSCEFCQNWDISQAPHEARKKDPLKWRRYFERLIRQCRELPPEKAVEEALAAKCRTIAFTYNEPTIFTEYALDIMDEAKDTGLRFVYVTNGYETPECWKILKGKLHAANIDLKSFRDEFYKRLCNGSLEPIKESIKTAKKYGIHIEVTTLVIPGENDSENELRDSAEFLASVGRDIPWHVTAFFPAYKMTDKPPTPVESLLKAREIGKAAGIRHVYVGNVPSGYGEYESTHCPKCKKVLIKRIGFVVVENNIKKGKCRFCKEKISGVWD